MDNDVKFIVVSEVALAIAISFLIGTLIPREPIIIYENRPNDLLENAHLYDAVVRYTNCSNVHASFCAFYDCTFSYSRLENCLLVRCTFFDHVLVENCTFSEGLKVE